MGWKKAALITAALMLLPAGFITLVLPGIVRSQAVQRVEAATGRKLAIGGISINPVTWTIELRDLSFSETGGGTTFVAFSSARIAVSPASLYRRAPIIAAAHIISPHLRIVRVGANSFNFTDLLKWLPLHPRLTVNNLSITNGSLDFIDHGLSVETRHEMRQIELSVPFVTTMPLFADRYVTPRLSAVLNGSPLQLEGRLRPFPRAVEASATVEFKDLSLPDVLAYVPAAHTVRVESGRVSAKVALTYRAAQKEKPELSVNGNVKLADMKIADQRGARVLALVSLDVGANLAFGGSQGLRMDNLSVQARQVSVPFGKREEITLGSLSLEGGRFSRKENLLEVGEVILKDGDFRFSRNRKGALLPLDLLYKGGKGSAKGETLLRYRIARISGSGMNAVFTDEMLRERPSFALKQITFSLEKLDGPPFAPIPFRVVGAYGETGALTASGSVSPTPWKLNAELAVQRIPLKDLNAYLARSIRMVVATGSLDARLAISLADKGTRLSGTFGGSIGIHSLYCLDAGGKDFLRWESLLLDSMKWGVEPYFMDIGAVALNRFRSRIVVAGDGSLNLKQLSTRKPGLAEKKTTTAGEGGEVRIGSIRMRDGTLIFADRHVTGGYTTTLFNLEGRINGLSSRQNRPADLDLRGSLDNRSLLRITGQINPLAANFFADLKLGLGAADLAPLSPYSGTYLGYAVDRGQLSLDSTYRVENRQLAMENKLLIDQLHFGRRIESDKATTLPVRLAADLLKNRSGEIRIDLPVTGRTDDAQFSVWRVMLETLKKLVLTAASNPFALLKSLLGGAEDLNSIGFDHGSAELAPGERDKLLKLATALSGKPALKIAVVGYVDRERDQGGYRNEQQLRSLAEARAAGVREFLVKQGKIDAARVILRSGEMYRVPAKEKESASRVEIEAAVE